MLRYMSKTFCPLPWIHLYAGNSGSMHTCCIAEEIFPKGILDNAGNPFQIEKQISYEKFWNSRHMKNIRKKMMRGEWPGSCRRCKIIENQGLDSARTNHLKDYGDMTTELLSKTAADGTAPLEIKYLDLRLGNICNLKCRMCGPKAAIGWVDDWNKIHPESEHLSEEDRSRFKNFDWYKSPELWRNLFAQVAFLERIHLAGGEPFLVRQTFDLLRECVRQDRAQHIELSFNTNLTKIPESFIELAPHFKKIRLMISLDGVGPVNDYIRTGSKWSVIADNISLIKAMQEKHGNIEILIACTVQIMNIFSLKAFAQEMQNLLKGFTWNMFLNPLREPSFHSIQGLPASAKKRVEAILSEQKDEFSNNFSKEISRQFDGLIAFMNEKDSSTTLPRFLEFTHAVDQLHGESMQQALPELARYLPAQNNH